MLNGRPGPLRPRILAPITDHLAPEAGRYAVVKIYNGVKGEHLESFRAFPADSPVFEENFTGDGNSLTGNAPNQSVTPLDSVQAFERSVTRSLGLKAMDLDFDGLVDAVFAARRDDTGNGEIRIFNTQVPAVLIDSLFVEEAFPETGMDLG